MKRLWLRLVLAASLSLIAAAGGLLVAGMARAQSVATGSLSFSGPAGEYITQGESESFSTSNGDPLVVSSATGEVGVQVFISATEWWTLEFDVPGSSVLAPGTYNNATRYPFNTTGPGLTLYGNGRGCNTLTGSFTVIDAVFGPQGYVQKFDATFVQHCEGATLAASGEVHISNPPPPAAAPSKQAAATSPKSADTSRPSATAPASGGNSVSRGNGTSTIGATGSGKAADTGSGGTAGDIAIGKTGAYTAAAHSSAVTPLLIALGIVIGGVLVAVAIGIGLGLRLRRQ
jgi:hypothetical protein